MLFNLDAGEHEDEPEALWALFDVLHVACGGHAGDDASIDRVARFIASHPPMRLGAHPSYPDRKNFGRSSMTLEPSVLAAELSRQLVRLSTIARHHQLSVASVKPHGALYHDANRDPALARLLVEAIRSTLGEVTLVGPPSGELHAAAAHAGLRYLREGFADRARRADGSLVPRSEPGALVLDPSLAAAQASALARSGEVDTICIHADTPSSLAIARAVRAEVGPVPISLGDRAVRFARPAVSAAALVRAIRAWPGVVDVVVARGDVAAYFDREPHVDAAMIAALAALPVDDTNVREVVLRARYDGPDLADVARATGLTVDDVVHKHAAATYRVDTIGFMPGFAYLAGLDPALVLSRRPTPRPRVPAGALAIAADRTAVYPSSSPGGWHLIGTVDEPMFGPEGARLRLGDRVRFER